MILSCKSPGVYMVYTIRLADCCCCSDSKRGNRNGTHCGKRRNNMTVKKQHPLKQERNIRKND
jgi:hypothetical protein